MPRVYTPHAQLIENEEWFGRRKEPTPEQLVVIEAYREKYLQAFGAYPAGRTTSTARPLRVAPAARRNTRDSRTPPLTRSLFSEAVGTAAVWSTRRVSGAVTPQDSTARHSPPGRARAFDVCARYGERKTREPHLVHFLQSLAKHLGSSHYLHNPRSLQHFHSV